MSRKSNLIWRGKEVRKRVEKATKRGIDRTMAEAVTHAKMHHPWIYRTGQLEGSIKIVKFAHRTGSRIRGLWGSVDTVYALPLEFGRKKGSGKKYPFLVPAAKATYRNLARNIKREFKRL